jgi:hypothetical protein
MHPPLVLVAALSVASAAVPPATHIGMSVSAALGPSAVAEALPLVAPNCLAHDDHAQPTCQEASAGAVDDTPQTRVDLPFAPPVFGRERRSVFVNPNGGLLFGQAPPCGSFFCAINGTWYDSVLPFVADLNPGNTAEGTVVYATAGAADPGGARFEVAWLNVQMFGSDTFEYSFGAALYPSGRIVFAYDAVRDPRHNTTETYGLYVNEDATAAAAAAAAAATTTTRLLLGRATAAPAATALPADVLPPLLVLPYYYYYYYYYYSSTTTTSTTTTPLLRPTNSPHPLSGTTRTSWGCACRRTPPPPPPRSSARRSARRGGRGT